MEAKKTPLFEEHKRLGAKIVEFGGYLMPVQYKGILEEHKSVRNSVGIFDVSHMGEFIVKGARAAAYLQQMTLNDVTKLVENRAQYSGMCYEHGGMVDDLIVSRFKDHYMLIVNASNKDKDFQWLQQHLIPEVDLQDISDDFCLFAVQGRNAEATLQPLTDVKLSEIKYYWFREGILADTPAFISRTGYTGEDGFEVGVEAAEAVKVWRAILDAGTRYQIEPIGLGARDTLRLEMKYALYGNDIDETTNPIEAGLGWITKVDKGEFVGRQAIVKIKENGAARKLVGMELNERAIARHGYKIVKDGHEIGQVTSGTFSPTLQKGIAMGYVNVPHHEIGTALHIAIRGKEVPAQVVKTPFYQRPY
ncbi:MAG: glycine cleavage system aminomethyltransferase GcvT [bacterium]